MLVFLVKMLVLALVINVPALIATAVVLATFIYRGASAALALSYSAFFLIGGAVARVQWTIAVEEDPETVGFYLFATIVLVAALCLLAVVISRHLVLREKPLQALFLLTAVLAVMQFSGVSASLLNCYARFYSAGCILTSLAVLVRTWCAPGPGARAW